MDTIVALATPPGRSAIGVIRLSGPGSLAMLQALTGEAELRPQPRTVTLQDIRNPSTGGLIDQALVSYFKSPASFTGEDVVEISCHGSPVVLREVIESVLERGGRLADPGEFTLRALRNGKLNLSQAEAIRDLISAQTDAAARQAVRQLNGELSAQLQPLKDELLKSIVLLESAVEFVEDDLPLVQRESLARSLAELGSRIGRLAATFASGHLLRDGLKVTIVGRPNTGKSTLFNALLGLDRAIVTDLPGTTRDTLSERISLGGVPITLTDTAGVRESSHQVEAMGIERTTRSMAEADLLLVVVDGSEELTVEDADLLERTAASARAVALNKCDLPTFRNRLYGVVNGTKVVDVSAKVDRGLGDLRKAILEPFNVLDTSDRDVLVTDVRHYDLLRRANVEIESACMALSQGLSEELILVGMHNALRFLGAITGETTTEDILTRIFATFCIGK